jgi:hypothetical protein
VRLRRGRCHDCRTDTVTRADLGEVYMVHNELWARAGMEPNGGFLCIGCLERRLGRRLTPDDFTDCPLNADQRRDREHHYVSDRLYSRLIGWHQLRLFDVGTGDG